MAEILPPAASADEMPWFMVAPGETDTLTVVMGLILVIAVVLFGLLFFRLHSLPERMAHKSKKIQFEIVAVLGLIALFTHMHIFWVAGLLLALIDFPDFGTSLGRIAQSTEKMAGLSGAESTSESQPDTIAGIKPADEVGGVLRETHGSPKVGDSGAVRAEPDSNSSRQKGLSHA
jgi:hypothetical protein